MSAYRPVITGTRHMIAAGHHAAAHAGFAILKQAATPSMQASRRVSR
jgi:gamma-glutamyltranspeptidase